MDVCPIPAGVSLTLWKALPIIFIICYLSGFVFFYKQSRDDFGSWVADLLGYLIIGIILIGLGLNLFYSVPC